MRLIDSEFIKRVNLYKLEYLDTLEWINEYLLSGVFMLDTDIFIVRDPYNFLNDYRPIIDWYVLTDFPKEEREEMKYEGCKIYRVSVKELLQETQDWLENFK